jgi:hypothetical protein
VVARSDDVYLLMFEDIKGVMSFGHQRIVSEQRPTLLYAIFLTEFQSAWQVNTDLLPFDLDEVKKDVETGNQAKKNKALWEAYQIAAEGHDLAHFKEMLSAHESAMQEDLEQREQKEQQKKDKAEKAAKRKSTAADSSEDVDMEDAGEAAPSAKKAKATKKRKKDDESDGESGKVCFTSKI